MSSAADFTRHVPGFDFLQGLMKNAAAGMPQLPALGQWIAPTLDPEELDKRIQELKTVQFWLEQNARLLATTIQALEVQRMTLSTLKTMNLPMADLTESLKIRPAAPARAPAPLKAEPAPPPEPPRRKVAAQAGAEPAPALVDPMQWWGALTQQFTELAAQAMKDTARDGAMSLAGTIVKQSVDSAAGAMKRAAELPAKATRLTTGATGAGSTAAKPAAKSARRAPRRP